MNRRNFVLEWWTNIHSMCQFMTVFSLLLFHLFYVQKQSTSSCPASNSPFNRNIYFKKMPKCHISNVPNITNTRAWCFIRSMYKCWAWSFWIFVLVLYMYVKIITCRKSITANDLMLWTLISHIKKHLLSMQV